MNEETTFWKGSPSQWLNIGPFTTAIIFSAAIITAAVFSGPIFPFVLCLLIIPFLYAFWCYLRVRCQTFELTTERLRVTKGVINQNIDEVELYRVKDMVVERKWWMRLTGLGNVHLETSDRSMPHVDIPAIRDCIGLREELRKKVEAMRDKKRVREMDFDETGDSEGFDDLGEIG
ncbi:PH domain-containing protein [Luteolibacter sp. AS25]|uniref:PH domain-containing protein n=1 Tax=Luteolibacter sp. AS25 TaxID=3135776 RepID=UPI00398B7ADB